MFNALTTTDTLSVPKESSARTTCLRTSGALTATQKFPFESVMPCPIETFDELLDTSKIVTELLGLALPQTDVLPGFRMPVIVTGKAVTTTGSLSVPKESSARTTWLRTSGALTVTQKFP